MALDSCLLGFLTIVTILETAMFSVFLAGWSSYVYVLMDNEFYLNSCNISILDFKSNSSLVSNFIKPLHEGKENRLNKSNNENAAHLPKAMMITAPPAKVTPISCKEQQEHLNLLYAISIGMVAVISVLWGPLIYRLGIMCPKLLSMMLFISGCLILGFSNPDIPLLIVPGMVLSGVGGLAVLCINMKVTSLLPFGAGLYVALLGGAADSSVITFRILKLLHDNGIRDLYTFIGIIAVHVILCGSSLFLHKLVDQPKKAITYSESSPTDVAFTKSGVNLDIKLGIPLTENVKNNMTHVDNIPAIFLKHSLCSWVTFSLMFWFSVLWLYFFLYIGTINSRLQSYNPDRVSHITNIMAYIMLGGLVTAFIPGSVAELQKKMFKEKKNSLEKSLLPNVVPLATTSLLAVLLNTLSFIESEAMFYIEFAVLTIFRSFLSTSNMSFILSAYPITHANIILPIGFMISGTTSTLQYALFVWYNHSILQVQVFMTLLLILSLMHPIVVYLTAKGVLKKTLGCCNNGTDRRDHQKPKILITHM